MPDFNTMTKAGIAGWARRRGLDLPMTMRKAQMVAAAEAHDAPAGPVRHVIMGDRANPVVLALDGKVHALPPGVPLDIPHDLRAVLIDAGFTLKETR